MKNINLCSLIFTLWMNCLNAHEVLNICEEMIETNGVPLMKNTTTIACMYKSIILGDKRYCKGLCNGQGETEGQTCAMVGINIDTNEIINSEYDCHLHDAMGKYSDLLGPFGK